MRFLFEASACAAGVFFSPDKVRFRGTLNEKRKNNISRKAHFTAVQPLWWLSSNWACPDEWESFGLSFLSTRKNTFRNNSFPFDMFGDLVFTLLSWWPRNGSI